MWRLGKLNTLSIGSQIALAFIIPVIALIGFTTLQLLEKRRIAVEMVQVERIAAFAPAISDLVHETQKERGASSGFVASKGTLFGDTLKAQRISTDARRAAFAAALDALGMQAQSAEFAKLIGEAQAKLDGLGQTRAAVDALALDVGEVAKYYTGAISALLSAVEHMAVLSENAEITKMITAYTTLLQAKERVGQERASGSAGFSAGRFAPLLYRRFIELMAEQRAYFKEFAVYATQAHRVLLASRLAGPVVDEVARMETVVAESGVSGNTGGIDAGQWFKAVTAKIDLLKEVEDVVGASLRARASELGRTANRSFMTMAAIAGLALLIGGVILLATARSIVREIKGMTSAMTGLAGGDTSIAIPAIGQRNEIGQMAGAVQIFRDNAIERFRLEAEREHEQEARRRLRQVRGYPAHLTRRLPSASLALQASFITLLSNLK